MWHGVVTEDVMTGRRGGWLAGLTRLAWLGGVAIALGCGPVPLAWAGGVGQACHLPGYEQELRCLTIDVPRDYTNPGKGKLALHVTLAPAFRENAKDDPLMVLAGGPGQAGSSVVALLDGAFQRVRATRNIVFIDQRGTGKSGKLGCPELEKKEITDPAQAERELTACLRAFKVDLSDYSTDNAARDIEQVRLALNSKTINLWGGSYGTRLAQAYARLFPRTLRSMILDGVVAPEQNVGLFSGDAGRAMALLRQQCELDAACRAAFPQFAKQLDDLVARATRGDEMIHFVHPAKGQPLSEPLRLESFAEQIRSLLYAPQSAVRVPWLVMQAAQGNWQPLMASSYGSGGGEEGMALGLTLAVLCAEDVAWLTPQDFLAEQSRSFVRDSWGRKLQRWCEVIHIPQRPRPSQTPIAAPTLLFSGRLDPVTPPGRAEATMRHLQKAQHVIVQQGGHIVSRLGCGPKLMRRFLDEPEQKLDARCLDEIVASPMVMSKAGAQP
jgi:pimeloyl-ACP methyl ester carboxylesterase